MSLEIRLEFINQYWRPLAGGVLLLFIWGKPLLEQIKSKIPSLPKKREAEIMKPLTEEERNFYSPEALRKREAYRKLVEETVKKQQVPQDDKRSTSDKVNKQLKGLEL